MGRRLDSARPSAQILIGPVRIAYLGSIYESELSNLLCRAEFWDKMSRRLDALANRIDPGDRPEIEAAISRKVPRPPEDERQAAQEKADRDFEAMASEFARIWRRRR